MNKRDPLKVLSGMLLIQLKECMRSVLSYNYIYLRFVSFTGPDKGGSFCVITKI